MATNQSSELQKAGECLYRNSHGVYFAWFVLNGKQIQGNELPAEARIFDFKDIRQALHSACRRAGLPRFGHHGVLIEPYQITKRGEMDYFGATFKYKEAVFPNTWSFSITYTNLRGEAVQDDYSVEYHPNATKVDERITVEGRPKKPMRY